jgi:hypothetical protein
MANQTFSEEYDTIRSVLASETFSSDKDAARLIRRLKSLLRSTGPDGSQGGALDSLRSHCERGFINRLFGQATDKESAGILALAGADKNLAKKAAALKALRHFHFMKKFGGHSLWVMSLPNSYKKWPSDQLGKIASKTRLAAKLRNKKGRFSSSQMRDLVNSSQTSAAWANRVHGMCTKTRGLGARRVDRLVKRWFADEDSTDDDIKAMRKTLAEGFKKIASAALSGKMVFTDNPIHRGTELEDAFAYVWYDRLNVVYIEGQFFKPGLFSGPKHWALIVVHELSHSQCNTVDVPGHYDHDGIKPNKVSYPASKAITNADNWAWFAADCNHALTAKNRSDALK